MRAPRWIAAWVVAGLASSIHAMAQTPATPSTIIESEGQASIDVAPDEVKFEFSKAFAGPTLIDAAAQAIAFEKSVTQALEDLDLKPLRQDPVRLLMAGTGPPRASAKISAVFAMPKEASGDAAEGNAPPLAILAEKLRKAGVSLSTETVFSGFGVKDHAPPEQEAVSRASENALYHAEAVGALLEGRIMGVERIVIVETGWDGLDAAGGALPIPPALKCHARVRISYQYSSGTR
jgi:hypothetical protein